MDSPEISTNARSSRYLIAAVLLAAVLVGAPVRAQTPTPPPGWTYIKTINTICSYGVCGADVYTDEIWRARWLRDVTFNGVVYRAGEFSTPQPPQMDPPTINVQEAPGTPPLSSGAPLLEVWYSACQKRRTINLTPGQAYEGALELPINHRFTILCEGDGKLQYLAYINGVRFSRCNQDDVEDLVPYEFKSRAPREDTVIIRPRWEPVGSVTLTVTVACDPVIGGFTLPPVPTPPPYPTLPLTLTAPISGQFGALGGIQGEGSTMPGPHSGLPLPDVGADASIWLGRANQVINLVTLNKSLLFISGAISLAGMIIGWAIKELRNPKDWEK